MNKSNNGKLAANILLMFLVYFLPKVFSFFLVPFYTNYLSTKEYGVADLLSSVAGFIQPIIALGIPNAILRYTIENKMDKKPIQFALRMYLYEMIILAMVLQLVRHIFKVDPQYLLFIYFLAGSEVLADMCMSYTKAVERMKIITICGVGNSLICIVNNIILIAKFNLGGDALLISPVIGHLFVIITLAIYNRKDAVLRGIFRTIDHNFDIEMLKYSIPLVISGLSWWIVSSSDRYFVIWMCGTEANGIYAVAYKIPTILQSIYVVFGQAWIFTLYDTYQTKEGLKYIAKVYDFYNFILCVSCSMLIAVVEPLSKFLYARDFFVAWRYVPPLLLSMVYLALGNFMGGFLNVYKKSKEVAVISVITSITNIVLNYIMIKMLKDPMGVAVATLISFFASFLINLVYGMRLSGIELRLKKQFFMYIVLICQAIVEIYSNDHYLAAVLFSALVWMNIDNIRFAGTKIKVFLKNRYPLY